MRFSIWDYRGVYSFYLTQSGGGLGKKKILDDMYATLSLYTPLLRGTVACLSMFGVFCQLSKKRAKQKE